MQSFRHYRFLDSDSNFFELYYNLVKLYRVREFGVISMSQTMLFLIHSLTSLQTNRANYSFIIFVDRKLAKGALLVPIPILVALILATFPVSVSNAQEAAVTTSAEESTASENGSPAPEAQTSAQPAKSTAKTVAAKVEPFKISLSLDAVIDSEDYQKVVLRSQALKELKLESFAQHGQSVSKGQQVFKLDDEPWQRAMHSAKQALASAELELKEAKKQAETIDETVRLEKLSAELAATQAREDFDYFLQQGKDQQIESQQQSLRSAERSVENAREEYEQLKKMYTADQITEETEEIVLRRAKFDVERAEYFLRTTKNRVQRFLDVELPRQETSMKNTVDRTQLDLERSRMAVDRRMQSARLQLARAEMSVKTARREVAKLQEDRQLLEVSASFPGAVLWGAADRGQWKGATGIEELMFVGNSIPPNRPVMTIIGTENLFVHCKVPERWSRTLQSGSTGELELTAIKNKRISVECEQVGSLPSEPGQFRAVFRFVRKAESQDLAPLMAGKVNLVAYEKENALTLPLEAVRRDSAGEYVLLAQEDDEAPKRQDIVVGWSEEKRVEVVQGLREGENVVLP